MPVKNKGEISYLMKIGFTEKEAEYIEQHPCLVNAEDDCESYKTSNGCAGCTNLNGFLLAITETNGKPKSIKETWNELSKKPVAFIFMNKEKE